MLNPSIYFALYILVLSEQSSVERIGLRLQFRLEVVFPFKARQLNGATEVI